MDTLEKGEVCTEIIVLEMESPSKKKSQETHITIVSSVLMSLQKEQKQFSEETYSCRELLTTIEKERKGRVAKEKNEEKCGNGKAKKCSIPPGKIWTCYLVISFRTIHILVETSLIGPSITDTALQSRIQRGCHDTFQKWRRRLSLLLLSFFR